MRRKRGTVQSFTWLCDKAGNMVLLLMLAAVMSPTLECAKPANIYDTESRSVTRPTAGRAL